MARICIALVGWVVFGLQVNLGGQDFRMPYSLKQLYDQSESVVFGKVESVVPKRGRNGYEMEYIEITLLPMEDGIMKGPLATRYIYHMTVTKVSVGEEVLVFLRKESNGVRIPVGVDEGHFRVHGGQVLSAREVGNQFLWDEKEAREWGIGDHHSLAGPVPLKTVLKALYRIIATAGPTRGSGGLSFYERF